jgi:hypothetical protein
MGWYVSKQHILRYVLTYTWLITVVSTPEAERKKRGLLQNQEAFIISMYLLHPCDFQAST